MSFDLTVYSEIVREAHDTFKKRGILDRIWNRDHEVWDPSPEEIANRLGWLDIASRLEPELGALKDFAEEIKADGVDRIVLMGMGGSSLAPEVFSKVFSNVAGWPRLEVLDSTDPAAVLDLAGRIDPARTLYIVATKSGGTVETFSFFKYFYNLASEALGRESAGRRFTAITDPGSGLVETASHYGFRRTFLNDPEIGGRYSALSLFGLVPAALLGVDLHELVRRANTAALEARDAEGLAARLGVALGALAREGRDKLTLIMSPAIASLGDWIEQLVAESTGKNGVGILPVVGETLAPVTAYGNDRVFVVLGLGGDEPAAALRSELQAAGHPVVAMQLKDRYSLGEQFFLWEMATAIAGHVLGIRPFDQPNVEAAKSLARERVAAFQETGREPDIPFDRIEPETIHAFLDAARPGDYISLQAYVEPGKETNAELARLREALRDRTNLVVTAGYGPRYLHSTGQLHKGDAGNGRFIQLFSTGGLDADIPDEAGRPESGLSFQVLKLAQGLGDRQALLSADPPRAVLSFDLGTDAPAGLRRIAELAGG